MSSAPEAPFSVWFWLQTQISIRPPVKTHTHGNNQIKITSKLAHTILQVKFKLILHLQIKTQRNFILLHFGCKRQASHSQQLCHPSFTFLQIYATATDKIRNRNIAKKKKKINAFGFPSTYRQFIGGKEPIQVVYSQVCTQGSKTEMGVSLLKQQEH